MRVHGSANFEENRPQSNLLWILRWSIIIAFLYSSILAIGLGALVYWAENASAGVNYYFFSLTSSLVLIFLTNVYMLWHSGSIFKFVLAKAVLISIAISLLNTMLIGGYYALDPFSEAGVAMCIDASIDSVSAAKQMACLFFGVISSLFTQLVLWVLPIIATVSLVYILNKRSSRN